MADKIVVPPDDGSLLIRYKDMGDGTWAEVIYSANSGGGGGGGGGGDASAANQLTEIARLEDIRDRLPSAFLTPGLLAVDTLGTPGTPRVQATSSAAASIALTSTCRRVSMYATQGTWYSISGTATNTSHYIAAGERLDFDVPASTTISVLRETNDGSVRITELV